MLLRKVYRDLVTRRVRSALTLLGVLVGVAGLVAIVGTAQGFARAQRATFATGERADLAVFLFDAPESLLRAIERVPGVVAADGRFNHYGRGRLRPDGPLDELHFLGLRRFDAQVADRLVLLEGRWPDTGEALAEPAAAARFGLRPGDTVTYVDAANRERPLRLSGLARLPSALSADLTGLPLVFVHASVAREMVGVPGFNELLVRLDPAASRADVGDAIRAALERRAIPKGELRFSDPSSFVGKRELDTLFLVLYLFSGLGVGLSGFIVANTLAALVAESVREIGILKSLGATRAQVLGTFALAAALYGAVGTLGGLAAGSALGWALLRVLGRLASLEPPLRLEPMALALGTVVGLGVTLLGGAIPAWQASGISAKAALDERGVSRRFGRSRLDQLVQQWTTKKSFHLPLSRYRERGPGGEGRPGGEGLPPLVAMGLRNLLRRKGRSGVTVAVVALAVAALLAAQATDGSVAAVLDRIFLTYRADAYLQFGAGATVAEGGALRRVAGVRRAEGWLLRTCTAGHARTRCWALPADSPFYQPRLIAGQWLDPRDPLGVVLSADLAAAQRLRVGDSFPLRYQQAERTVTVRGIVEDNAIFLGSDIQSKLFVAHPTFAALSGSDEAADIFAIGLEPRGQREQQAILDEVSRKLAALRPSSTLALSEFETSKEQTRILTAALRGMVLLVALVGAMGLVNTLALNVLERRREIGVLRAIGTDDGQLLRLFVTEGVGLGVAGWALGLGLGWALGRAFVGTLASTLFAIPFHFPPTFALTSLAFALLLALLASVAPALAAANLPTVEAIRYE